MVIASTPVTSDVAEWVEVTYPLCAIEHTPECDRVSYGSACVGGCAVVSA